MLRQSVRKTTRKGVRRPAKRAAAATTAKSRKAVKRTAAQPTLNTPIFVPRIVTLNNNLKTYVERRIREHGPSDAVAKRLHTLQLNIGRELRKKNIINPSLTKYLGQIQSSVKGVTGVP